jgi:hypothetical protein
VPARDERVKARAFLLRGVEPNRLPVVIALASDLAPLDTGERFALDLLLDLSCALRVEGSGDVVRLRVIEATEADGTMAALRARGYGIDVRDGEITVERATLALVLELAGAVGEQRSTAADRFGRVPSSENALVRSGEGAEREPVVSVIAFALRQAIPRAAGRRAMAFLAPWPEGRRWAAALTHDLDVVEWWPAFTALRLAELARKGELVSALRVVGAVARRGGRDVVWQGVREVLDAEAAFGVRSSWFILCGNPTLATMRAGDLTYRPENPATRRILEAVREAGHEIGLHGSFATSDDHSQFTRQRSRLDRLIGGGVAGVRQHYLRMRPGATPRGMAVAGFGYDSTFGFADRNGFRLGVADLLPTWDDAGRQALALDEAPFVWMDRALSKYRGVEHPDAWIDDAFALAEQCRAVNGLWVGIWHPNLTPALGFPGAPAAYARLVAGLVDHGAWIAPLGELAAWRRTRRAARASTIAPDGKPVLATVGRIALETADGRPLEAHVGR